MPEFYKGKIPVIRRSLNEGFISGEPDTPPVTGAIPRDFDIDPVEMRDSPDAMQTYSESDWDALFDKGEENEDTLEHIYLRGARGGRIGFIDQNGFPDCWVHSVFNGVMLAYLVQNLPVPHLNAVAAATMMNQTNGGWCGLGMKFAREKGCPPVGTGPGEWPYQTRRGKDTPELRANMAKYRVLEDWYDLGKREYDQDLSKQQIVTCLLNNHPTPSDYNRFGHSMLSLRRVRIERGSSGLLTLNSWKGFGYHGLCVLAEMWPDGACSLRTTSPVA